MKSFMKNKSQQFIAIDANEANIAHRVGIGRYSFEILWGIYRINILNKDKIHFQIYLKYKPLSDLPPSAPYWQYIVIKPSFLWSQFALPFHLKRTADKPLPLFSISHYAPLLTNVKRIILVLDLSYLYYPELFKKGDLFKLKYWTHFSVQKAEMIITISQFSKGELVKHYGIDPEKIIVAYPGIDRQVFTPSAKRKVNNNILFVGTLQPRKNITGLIKAFSILARKRDLKLTIVGKKGWLYRDIFALVKRLALEKKVIFTDFIKDSKLVSLYRQSLCFVLPSFYEGFGIPVIEAMSCGCPVLVAKTSSLPEIVGPAGLFFDPKNIRQLANLLEKVCFDRQLRTGLVNKGLQRAKYFNWEKSAEIIYTTIINTARI